MAIHGGPQRGNSGGSNYTVTSPIALSELPYRVAAPALKELQDAIDESIKEATEE